MSFIQGNDSTVEYGVLITAVLFFIGMCVWDIIDRRNDRKRRLP